MKEIKQTAIVGMGALGLLFGNQIAETIGADKVYFVADDARVKRYEGTKFTINGEEKNFIIKSKNDATPVDLVIVATKYNHLREAIDIIKKCVGKDTIIISILNGISSEESIAARYGWDKVVHCVAQGMDAVKVGGDLTYMKPGELRIGKARAEQEENLKAVINFFEKAKVPYTFDEDILYRMWGKFMLNVGINQTCMVYETTYQGAIEGEAAFKTMTEAMQEAMAVGDAEGIHLTKQDIDDYVALIKTLNPDAMPSMRQDGMAQRPSEVEMFAGKIIELGKKHQIDVPTNEWLYKRIKEMEAKY